MGAECLSSCSHSISVLLSHKINANAYSGVRAIEGPFLYILVYIHVISLVSVLCKEIFPHNPLQSTHALSILEGGGG